MIMGAYVRKRVYPFPRATVRKHHSWGGLKQPVFVLCQFWRPEVSNPAVSRAALPLQGPRKNLPCLSLAPEVAHSPGCSSACGDTTPPLPLPSRDFSLCLSLPMAFSSLCLFSCYEDESHIGLRTHPAAARPHRSSFHPPWPYFQKSLWNTRV